MGRRELPQAVEYGRCASNEGNAEELKACHQLLVCRLARPEHRWRRAMEGMQMVPLVRQERPQLKVRLRSHEFVVGNLRKVRKCGREPLGVRRVAARRFPLDYGAARVLSEDRPQIRNDFSCSHGGKTGLRLLSYSHALLKTGIDKPMRAFCEDMALLVRCAKYETGFRVPEGMQFPITEEREWQTLQ